MRHNSAMPSLSEAFHQFLTPQVWKQAHQVWSRIRTSQRWALMPLVWVAITMSWCGGQSQEERFALARAAYVAQHPRSRRPGKTLTGFLSALSRVPLPVLRALARGVRQRLGQLWVESLRVGDWVPMACDGSRVECPRSAELQQRLGEAGKPGSSPTVYLTTLVLLPIGVVWSWSLGKGTADERFHLRKLLRTLPRRSLLVADAYYLGYQLFRDIVQAQAAFLVRMSSKAYLYTTENRSLKTWTEGLVYYWPQEMQRGGLPPLHVRLLQIKGRRSVVWLLTSVLDAQELSRSTAGRLYRWRWRNEGLFRDYKRLLQKVKLTSRTVALVHREAEASLLALQLLLALAVPVQGSQPLASPGSPRRQLLRLRYAIQMTLRQLGPRQMAQYQRMLTLVRSQARPHRRSAKVRQKWPRRKEHTPPKPPKLRVMSQALKTKANKALQVA
jgi:hypothetical protein